MALVGPLPPDLGALDRVALLAEVVRRKSATDAAYWTFTRTARGRPPGAELYTREAWAREALRRSSCAT